MEIQNKAIRVIEFGHAEVVDSPIPKIRENHILASVQAWALNPTVWKHVTRRLGNPGALIGCDWSGVVREVGAKITRFKPGDEVIGACHGGKNNDHEIGAFAYTVLAKEGMVMHKPPHMSFEEASTMAVGVGTTAQAMYQIAKFRLPTTSRKPGSGPNILIYGGSTATGTIAIQFAKLSGCVVYTTCSPRNFALVKDRGADHVFDYNSPSAVEDVRAAVGERPLYVFDCIGQESTAAFCASVMPSAGGHYHSIIMPVPANFKALRPEENVRATTAMGYTLWGEDVVFPNGREFPARLEDYEFISGFISAAEPLISKSLVRPHPADVRSGGLEGVLKGLKELEEKRTTGGKLVYTRD